MSVSVSSHNLTAGPKPLSSQPRLTILNSHVGTRRSSSSSSSQAPL